MKLKLKETLAKILLYLLKGERRTLLWTNPNKEANYDGGTVSLDLSDYDEVDILCYAGGQIVDRLQVPVGSVGKLSEVGGTGGYNSGGITVITRLCTVTNSGVVFTSAYLGYDGQTMMQGFNHNLKPYKIYGIKVGGVLRNSVISRLTAIFTSLLFGGGVDEVVIGTDVGKDTDKAGRNADVHGKNVSSHNKYHGNIWGLQMERKHRAKRVDSSAILIYLREQCSNHSWSRRIRQYTNNGLLFEIRAHNHNSRPIYEGIAISERGWAA